MVISTNPKPEIEEFLHLLDSTTASLNDDAITQEDYFISNSGSRLENIVCERMGRLAEGSNFEGTIKLISGQRFPDIVANKLYGIEVKSTTQNHWKTTGNSVLESTRVEDVERIFMLFGKLAKPVEFRYRAYEECLSEVVVTHSPRYLINMNLNKGETIFDKISMTYDNLRTLDNPVRPIVDYYKSKLKEGEELWWIDSSKPDETSSSIAIRLWTNLTMKEKHEIIISAMAYFPELFGNCNKKYGRLAVWLVSKFGIVSPSLRDTFTAGGQVSISFSGRTYRNVPRIFERLINNTDEIFSYIENQEKSDLSYYWGKMVTDSNKLVTWIDLISEHSRTVKFNPKPILIKKLKEYNKTHSQI